MNPELAYFLKINVGIALFYAFYRLFFYKDTFFTWRRTTLLCFLILALVYPLMNLQEWIKGHEPMVAIADLYASAVLPEFTVNATQAVDWKEIIIRSLGYLYLAGVVMLCFRFLMQLSCIIHLRLNCQDKIIQGKLIYRLPKEAGPFSFFHWIFIYPALHTNEELDEILTHELTHARQYHSADVLFSELVCIACWFNPFAWLMKREVRSNLEYLADLRVIEAGHNYQSYQFHLLGLAHQKAAANLSNSFNVLPLKNRIKMMNKKRTKEIGRSKYFMFLPMAALLIIVSNIETVARSTKSMAKEVMQTMEQEVGEQLTGNVAIEQTPQQDKTKTKQATPAAKLSPVQAKGEDPVFEVVEQMPDFPGGMQELMKFLSSNIKYPAQAHKENRQGRVIVQFVVRKDGQIVEPKIAKSVSPDLDAEALRVISIMPNWTPGRQRGEAVSVKFTVPIMFRLSDEDKQTIESKLPEVAVVGYAPEESSTKTSTAFEVVEEMPQFIGGMNGLMKYLGQNIKYPAETQQSKTEGRVIVSMIVDKTGKVTEPRVLKSVSPALDAEAIRVVSQMPQWIPGKQKGEAVNVKYTLPISFKLVKPAHTPTKIGS